MVGYSVSARRNRGHCPVCAAVNLGVNRMGLRYDLQEGFEMVNYMWGKDIADALLASEAVSEDCQAVMRAMPLRMPIEFKPIDK